MQLLLYGQVQSEKNLLLGIIKKEAETINVSHSSPLFHGSRGPWEKSKSWRWLWAEIPVRYHFLGPAKPRCRIFCAKALDWLKRKLETGKKKRLGAKFLSI